MIKKIEIIRQKLFDGDEGKCLYEVFKIGNQKIKLIDFYNTPLQELKKQIDEESFNKIIKENKFNLINNFIEKYTSENGLEVYYLKKTKPFIYFLRENINQEDISCFWKVFFKAQNKKWMKISILDK